MDIASFIKQQGVDEYGVTSIADLKLAYSLSKQGGNTLESGSVIVLLKQIPIFIFDLENKLKSFYLFQFMRDMDNISFRLAQALNQHGHRSVPAATFFPARIEEGKLNSMIPLKSCAANAGLGSIGQNTLLISPRLGNRICLSAVLIDQELASSQLSVDKPLCTGCGKCIESCPGKALTPGHIDIFKCLNFNHPIPALMRPVVSYLMKGKNSRHYIELSLNTMGWNVDMVCSECLTACPHFKKAVSQTAER
ncbi:MAG: 4Fe-4S double cluster binding domain-containing protein [Syntrophomonadaceae bacterium]|nr:4Fe-4S double cluster binding domain-containing protein [Syntrophomonadaceae bacterium]